MEFCERGNKAIQKIRGDSVLPWKIQQVTFSSLVVTVSPSVGEGVMVYHVLVHSIYDDECQQLISSGKTCNGE
eukprot:14613328-Ditylum_brightwellii.AAC.1